MKVLTKNAPENSDIALRAAVETAKERGLDIIAATTGGATGIKLSEIAEELGYQGHIVLVSHAYRIGGENPMPAEVRSELEKKVYRIVTAAHALSGGERGISSVYKGMYPLEIVAQTLRMFGPGVKVCVECAMMAADNGAVKPGVPAVCIGGTGRGADTVCIVSPAPSSAMFETKINEVLVKPGLYE